MYGNKDNRSFGAGVMGNGIAQVAAMAGYNVIMRDIEDRFVEGGIKNIDKFLSKSVEKGKMTADAKKEASWAESKAQPTWLK